MRLMRRVSSSVLISILMGSLAGPVLAAPVSAAGGFAQEATTQVGDEVAGAISPKVIREVEDYFPRTSEGLARCQAVRMGNSILWTSRGWRHGTTTSCQGDGGFYHLEQWYVPFY